MLAPDPSVFSFFLWTTSACCLACCLACCPASTRRPAPPSVSSPVELLISQTLCWVHDDLDQVDFSSYLLKVCGKEEVLQK